MRAALIAELHTLGVRTVMVTGDAPATAAIVARAVALVGPVCPPGPIPDAVHIEDFAVFAGVLPEGKYDLVKAFQKGGHAVGMCRDGANDAPALRQAQMGIAVSTATDVAKSAAGIVLTAPGLGGIVASIKEGRVTFQRILTYAVNSVTKKTVQVLFLAVGLVITGQAILTPMLMVIIMLTGDLLGMSLTTDNVRPSPMPNVWRIGTLTIAGVFMGISELVFCTAVLAFGKFRMGLGIETLRTLAFVAVAFGNQATTYTNRERQHWGPLVQAGGSSGRLYSIWSSPQPWRLGELPWPRCPYLFWQEHSWRQRFSHSSWTWSKSPYSIVSGSHRRTTLRFRAVQFLGFDKLQDIVALHVPVREEAVYRVLFLLEDLEYSFQLCLRQQFDV